MAACILFSECLLGQTRCTEFIRRSGSSLSCGSLPWYGVGVNCYYLQNLAAYGDTAHCDEVFREAQALGISLVRTWGFFDSPDSSNPAVLQWAPGRFNESAFRALDYVIAKAREYSIRLIIPLVNNWEDYGGMNQYVQWYAALLPRPLAGERPAQERVITGAGGRQYHYQVSAGLTHDDFYTQPVIREWYKNYIAALIGRINTFTGVAYRDDPTILAWELANEARSSDPTGGIVTEWMRDISSFMKSADPQHLLSTGEEGLDTDPAVYGGGDRYAPQGWLLEGAGGVSFSRNTGLPAIDIASIHCYPAAWQISLNQGLLWLEDHKRIADMSGKPLIMGEVGVLFQERLFYEAVLNEGYFDNSAGILLWQMVYPGRADNDGYAFSCPGDEGICEVLATYAAGALEKQYGAQPAPARTALLESYPNPFRDVTAVRYSLSSLCTVHLEVFNSLGQSMGVLTEEEQPAGVHVSLLDARRFTSGMYFLRIQAGGRSDVRKVVVAR